jgi:hypothetical protein
MQEQSIKWSNPLLNSVGKDMYFVTIFCIKSWSLGLGNFNTFDYFSIKSATFEQHVLLASR